MEHYEKGKKVEEWKNEIEMKNACSKFYSTYRMTKEGRKIYITTTLMNCAVINQEYDLIKFLLENSMIDPSGYTQENLYYIAHKNNNDEMYQIVDASLSICESDGTYKYVNGLVSSLLCALLVEDERLISLFIEFGVDQVQIVEEMYAKNITKYALELYRKIMKRKVG